MWHWFVHNRSTRKLAVYILSVSESVCVRTHTHARTRMLLLLVQV